MTRTHEADVVIVGYGGAGAVAAITAHDAGASVLVLEKTGVGGGNTRISGGSIQCPIDMAAADHIEALSVGKTPRTVIETYVRKAMENERWIKGLGAATDRTMKVPRVYPYTPPANVPWWPKVPGGTSIHRFKVAGKKSFGENFWDLLDSQVSRRGILVLTDTPAKELLPGIAGVVAESGGKQVTIKARRAVILACGGYASGEALKETFYPCPFDSMGHPGNTGDGIVMALKAGASLWHMTGAAAYLGFRHPDGTSIGVRMPDEHFICVDRYGKRFANETGLDLHDWWRPSSLFDPNCLCFPRIPTYAIFDENFRKKGPLAPGHGGGYEWSKDNSAEIARGWIKPGQTIGQLARALSLPEAQLEETIASYNDSSRKGVDKDFGRSKETLVALDNPPFSGVALWPSLLNTLGGPRRDSEARVLDHSGRPIPRLYSTGELGSVWAVLYVGGGNLAECIAFGRIAGQNAAAEKPSH